MVNYGLEKTLAEDGGISILTEDPNNMVKFSTGLPYTKVLGTKVNLETGNEENTLAPRFSSRMPSYFRWDLYFQIDRAVIICPIPFLPISNQKFLFAFPLFLLKGETRFGLYNILGRKNAIRYYYDQDKKTDRFINDFPFMPIFGYKFIF